MAIAKNRTVEEQLKEIDEKINKAKAQKQKILNREKDKQRKNDTRAKVLMGSTLAKAIADKKISETLLKEILGNLSSRDYKWFSAWALSGSSDFSKEVFQNCKNALNKDEEPTNDREPSFMRNQKDRDDAGTSFKTNERATPTSDSSNDTKGFHKL